MIRNIMMASVLVLTGCVTQVVPPKVAQELQAKINSENQACDQQYYRERLVEHRMRYSHWAECRADKVMPLEKQLFPNVTQLVQQKYDVLVSGMRAVEEHQTTEKEVLVRANKINDKYNRSGCPVEYFGADAHPQCDAE